MSPDKLDRYKKLRTSYIEDNDMFSKLHDDLLINILCFLRSKEAARTSILSKRWRHLCEYINKIDFDYTEPIECSPKHAATAYAQFHKFLMNISEPNIRSFDVQVHHKRCSTIDQNLLGLWLTWAVEHAVEKLVLKINDKTKTIFYNVPKILSECKSIVELKLSNSHLCQWNKSPISWPLLKDLSFNKVKLYDLELKNIICNCVLLERLSLVSCQFTRSFELRSDIIKFSSPTLRYLELWDCTHKDNIIIIDLPSLDELSINMLLYNNGVEQRAVLDAAYSVRTLTAGFRCLLALSRNSITCLTSVTHLKMDLNLDNERSLNGMAFLISRCPNLQTLIINFKKFPYDRNLKKFPTTYYREILEYNLSKERQLELKTVHVYGVHMYEINSAFKNVPWRCVHYPAITKKTHVIKGLLKGLHELKELVLYLVPNTNANQKFQWTKFFEVADYLQSLRKIASSVNVSAKWGH